MTTPAKMTLRHSPLHSLVAAHEFNHDLNPRKTGRAEIADMVEMIKAAGLLVPLIVITHPDKPQHLVVVDGNRRLEALRALWPKDAVVPAVTIEGDPSDPAVLARAREAALMTNIGRAPLHALDQFEHFRIIYDASIENGADAAAAEQTIATRFAKKPADVRRVLALGGLHPDIRAAWRDGGFGRDPESIVQAFAMIPNPDEQQKLLKKLAKRDRWQWASDIRKAAGSSNENGKLLRFVGVREYEAQGGRAVQDLFGKNDAVSDVALLTRLAGEKMQRACEGLIAAGWLWAVPISEAGPTHYSWSRIHVTAKPTRAEAALIKQWGAEIEAMEDGDDAADDKRAEIEALEASIESRAFSDKDRARSGCIVSLDHTSALNIDRGYIKPGTKAGNAESAKTKKKTKGAAEAPAGGVSNNLMADLSLQATLAMQEAIIGTKAPEVGLIVLLAAILEQGYIDNDNRGAAAECRPGAKNADDILGKPQPVSATVERFYADKSVGDLLELAKRAAAACIDLQIGYRKIGALDTDGTREIIACLDKRVWNAAIEKHFDRAAFLARAPMVVAKQAIEECGGIVPKGGKDIIVKTAVAATKERGWLPQALRTLHYAGPGNVATTTHPKKKAAKRGVARKGQGKGKKRK